MTTIQMVEIDADEVMHLFKVIEQHDVSCGLELKMDESADPILGMPTITNVSAEYIEGTDGDSVVIHLDDAEFAFELGKHTFYKHISDRQIDISVAGDNYSAWFNSDTMSPEAIEEANSYTPLEDKPDDIEICIDPTHSTEEYNESIDMLSTFLRQGLHVKEVLTYGYGTAQRFRLNYPGEGSAN